MINRERDEVDEEVRREFFQVVSTLARGTVVVACMGAGLVAIGVTSRAAWELVKCGWWWAEQLGRVWL
jgi:hypothetical protein